MPWNARNMILRKRRLVDKEYCEGWVASRGGTQHHPYSCNIEDIEPQTMEKMVNKATANKSMNLRPRMSLNLA